MRTLKTVGNAVRLLDTLSRRGPMGLAALSRELRLGKSTVHLLLQTLMQERMIDLDAASGTYRIGLHAYEIGMAAVDQLGLGAPLTAIMERLARVCNETVSLAVMDEESVIFVQRLESPEILRADLRPGTRMPLHASASGKVLLADLDHDQLLRLFPETTLPGSANRTCRHRDDLFEELARVRRLGFARNLEEFADGIAAVAAPVRNASGQVVAALSIASPVARFQEDPWLEPLCETAAALSRAIGFVPNSSRSDSAFANGLARSDQVIRRSAHRTAR